MIQPFWKYASTNKCNIYCKCNWYQIKCFHVNSNARLAWTFDNTLKPAVKCTSQMWCDDSSHNFDSIDTWQQHMCNAHSYAWHVKQQHGA